MDKVKEFMEFLFAKEQEALDAGNKKAEFEKYNTLAAQIKSYMNDETVGFGLPVLTRPKPDFFYDDDPVYPNPRHLYKISHYSNEKYGDVWACYVSFPNADNDFKKISECFLVAKIGEGFKIISSMVVVSDTKQWRHVGGDEDKSLRLNNLGKPLKVERYTEPNYDDWHIKEYNKEK